MKSHEYILRLFIEGAWDIDSISALTGYTVEQVETVIQHYEPAYMRLEYL